MKEYSNIRRVLIESNRCCYEFVSRIELAFESFLREKSTLEQRKLRDDISPSPSIRREDEREEKGRKKWIKSVKDAR